MLNHHKYNVQHFGDSSAASASSQRTICSTNGRQFWILLALPHVRA